MQMPGRYQLLKLFKVAAFFISVIYISWHISRKPELHDPAFLLQPFKSEGNIWFLFIVLLLMLLNWSLEALKWKMLLASVEDIGFIASLRAVFSGVTVSFYTPNRIGEFAGRILHLEPEHRIRGALATFVGSTAQIMITFQAGCAALIYFREEFLGSGNTIWIIVPAVSVVCFLPLLWFQIPRLANLRFTGRILRRYPRYLEVFEHYHARELMQVYLLSAGRYLIFCTQQYFLLHIAGFTGTWFLSTGLSAFSFMLITVIPSIALGELGMRGGINLFVFSPFTTATGAILFSTFLLWIINLAIPALIGAVGLLYIKIKRIT